MREQSSFRWFPRRTKSLLAGALVLGLVGFFSGSATTPTEATWIDQELAGDHFAALVVPAPTATRECTYASGKAHLFWKLPSGYRLADMRIIASTYGLGSVLAPITGFSLAANTTLRADSTYETTMSSNLLGGLLGLGDALEVAIVTRHGTWESAPLRFETSPGLVLGLGSYCDNL